MCMHLCVCARMCRYTHTQIYFSPIQILLYLPLEYQVEQKWASILALGFKISRWVNQCSLNNEVNSVTQKSIKEVYFSQLFQVFENKIPWILLWKLKRSVPENMDKKWNTLVKSSCIFWKKAPQLLRDASHNGWHIHHLKVHSRKK